MQIPELGFVSLLTKILCFLKVPSAYTPPEIKRARKKIFAFSYNTQPTCTNLDVFLNICTRNHRRANILVCFHQKM